jgi:hypothetical protein
MQDGEFQEGQLIHPVGKAIFIFAGGTSHTFEEFKTKKALKEAKGPDFLSRLKGFLNISGPNPQEKREEGDPYFIVRRALLLRSLYERLAPQLLDEHRILRIDPGILRAFLEIRRYEHGARSMESIIAMSKLGNATHFNRSALPPEEQLSLHVEPKAFMSLVHQLELDGALLERLARLNHEYFCEDLEKQGYVWGEKTDEHAAPKTHSSLVLYEQLPEHEQEQNCSAVRDIPNKLAVFGYAMVPRRNNEPDCVFPEDVLEDMAKLEHERWMQLKFRQGWKHGAETDKDHQLHALLVNWAELPDEEKRKDRLIIEKMSAILGKAGYTIVRLVGKTKG